MERVETLLKKLQDQFRQNEDPSRLLLTVQMLQAELLHVQSAGVSNNGVAVTVSTLPPVASAPIAQPPVTQPVAPVAAPKKEEPEEKIIEVLQVDEAEIDAELEEIKRNAETLQKISQQNKPHIVFEEEEDVPTLSKQEAYRKPDNKKEINETVTGSASLNEKLKQSKIDLGDTLIETPIRDLRKAIGVNDRFLFINELFRGDEAVYERSIKTINSFSILPEAEYWIQRELKVKNGWVDSNPVVKQFDQLVKRRFS